jgi:hypothetical protein
MSAGQELLLRRHLTERLVPLVSAWVPLFGPMTGCLWSRDRRSATVTANLPDHTFTIATNCKRDGQKNPDANTVFWLHLTIFRMNTCAKRVGGWGVSNPSCYFNSLRFWVPQPSVSRVRSFHGPTPVGVQLHPRSDCATVRLKVQVRTSREAAVPCAHL